VRVAVPRRPFQAAAVSAVSFTSLALVQIIVILVVPDGIRIAAIATTGFASLAGLGALGGQLAGGPRLPAALRVLLGGGLAMGVSAVVGKILGAVRF